MRTFVLLGVSLLLGITFYEKVPGKHVSGPLLRDFARVSYGTDAVASAYLSAQHAVAERLGASTEASFPGRGFFRAHVSRRADGSFDIASWVSTRGAFGEEVRRPWSARVYCAGQTCEVARLEIKR